MNQIEVNFRYYDDKHFLIETNKSFNLCIKILKDYDDILQLSFKFDSIIDGREIVKGKDSYSIAYAVIHELQKVKDKITQDNSYTFIAYY